MSNNEAKFILSAYRPGGHDADDPTMARALAQAKNDPALGAWFAREQKHDAAVAAKLAEIAPPAGLRAAILAGANVSGGAVRETGAMGARDEASAENEGGRSGEGVAKNAPTRRRVWWTQPVWLAAAAAMAVLLSLAAWRMAPVRGATLEEFAVNFVDKGFRLQKRGADVAELKTWLGEQHGPLPETLPVKFAELRAMGCRTLNFKGQDVSLVCFERGGREFHVFVARRESAPDRAGGADGAMEWAPHVTESGNGKLVAAAWTDAKNRYVLVSDAGLEAVKRLL